MMQVFLVIVSSDLFGFTLFFDQVIHHLNDFGIITLHNIFTIHGHCRNTTELIPVSYTHLTLPTNREV